MRLVFAQGGAPGLLEAFAEPSEPAPEPCTSVHEAGIVKFASKATLEAFLLGGPPSTPETGDSPF